MKRLYTLLLGLMMAAMSASAMSYDEAAREAYYLTDKMAYELNLTDYQYDRVYQINFDYFLRLHDGRDAYGYLWEYRNASLARVLYTKQYRKFNRRDYFYRPLRWMSGAWYLYVYDRYSRDRWYRPAPPPAYHGPHVGHYHGPSTPPPPPHHGGAPDHRPGYGQPQVGGSHGGSHTPHVGGQTGSPTRPQSQTGRTQTGRPQTPSQPSYSPNGPSRTQGNGTRTQTQPSRSQSNSSNGGAVRGGRR